MCGIAGLIGIPPSLAVEAAARMHAALQHRGPDGSGCDVVPGPGRYAATLLHTRLAILDLSPAGRQPMADRPPSPTISPNCITFNGEIFNYRELQPELAQAGWPCRTRSDTEAILHAYRVWGTHCVERFRGMFAWCLLDQRQGLAWLCRDRLGVKPLYTYRPSCGGLLFASEVRTLLAAGPHLVAPRVSRPALEAFLAQGAVFGHQSVIDGIELLPPGDSLTVDWDGVEVRRCRYWSLPSAPAVAPNRPEAVQSIGERLRDAVRLRLIADVPLGLFLSGGIDSGALTAVATEVADVQIRTISVGFDHPDYDETAVAAQVAVALGTKHSVIRLTGQAVLDALPAFLAAIDQPTVDGFNTFLVCQSAREAGLTVALSGLGGDELFGGYASFRDVPRGRWLQSLATGLGPAARVARWLLRQSGLRVGVKTAELLARPNSPTHRYLLRRELFLPTEPRRLHPLPSGSDPSSGLPSAFFSELDVNATNPDAANQVSRLELLGYMAHMLLRDADVFSMVHGIELRVPLLDHLLVEAVVPLPGAWKRPDPRPKPLLIDAVGARLPAFLARLPKKGFTFPWGPWLRGPLRPRAEASVRNGGLWSRIGFDPAVPLHLWDRFLVRDRRISPLQILAFVVLEDYLERHGLQAA